MTDTVGFIRKLPHQLVNAFAATLEETKLADLVLHVVDAHETEEELLAMTRAVDDVLEEIGAGDTPRLLVLNKADLLDDERRRELSFRHPEGYLVSAVTGEGLEELGEAVADAFERALQDVDLLVPFSEGQTLSELHDVAGDLEREDTADGVRVTARLPAVVAERYDRYANGASLEPGPTIGTPRSRLTVFIVNCEFDASQAGQLGELVHVEAPRRRRDRRPRRDQVVGKAEHPPAFDDLLERGEGRLEALDGRAVLEREIHVHDDLEAAPDALGVDVGVIAANRACGLERADAAQARGGRQAHALGELDVAEAPVGLQLAQNRPIERIHWQIMPDHCRSRARDASACPTVRHSIARSMDPARRMILRDAAGVGLAVGVYGVSFGVLAVAAGASVAQAMALSLLVFTGASQFAFVGVIAGGGSAAAAVAPALMLAARNGIYGLSLAPVLTGTCVARLLQSHLVIDESTAMARAEDSPVQCAHRVPVHGPRRPSVLERRDARWGPDRRRHGRPAGPRDGRDVPRRVPRPAQPAATPAGRPARGRHRRADRGRAHHDHAARHPDRRGDRRARPAALTARRLRRGLVAS